MIYEFPSFGITLSCMTPLQIHLKERDVGRCEFFEAVPNKRETGIQAQGPIIIGRGGRFGYVVTRNVPIFT